MWRRHSTSAEREDVRVSYEFSFENFHSKLLKTFFRGPSFKHFLLRPIFKFEELLGTYHFALRIERMHVDRTEASEETLRVFRREEAGQMTDQ